MGKKSKRAMTKDQSHNQAGENKFSQQVEDRYKNILKIISWIMSVSFVAIIVLANFDFYLVDFLVKFLFFLGLANLLLFTLLEIFSKTVKKLLAHSMSEKIAR
jgi:hypothetical protein